MCTRPINVLYQCFFMKETMANTFISCWKVRRKTTTERLGNKETQKTVMTQNDYKDIKKTQKDTRQRLKK